MVAEDKKDIIKRKKVSLTEKIPDYRKLIIEMIKKIDNEKFLRRTYIIISDYLKEKAD